MPDVISSRNSFGVSLGATIGAEELGDGIVVKISELPDPLRGRRRAERRQDRAAGKAFATACASGDIEAFLEAVDLINIYTEDGWRHAFRNIELVSEIPPAIQTAFLRVWIENKSIAAHFESDLPVIRALWKLIPPDSGMLSPLNFRTRSPRPFWLTYR